MSTLRNTIKKIIPKRVFEGIGPTGHLLEAVAFSTLHGQPARGMRVIGITGTNGKTTTSFMIHNILTEAGINAALMTTVGYGVGRDINPQIAHMTTVSPPLLQKRLAEFKKAGAEWLVMEVTSHALAQHRDWGIPYEVAVLTNVTHEHLDYHRTFERYRTAKLLLFKSAAKHGLKLGIINADDQNAKVFAEVVPNNVTYGIQHGGIRPVNLVMHTSGSSYDVTLDGTTYHVDCPIPGDFNVSNSLAAVSVGHKLGLPKEAIERGIAQLQSIEGRMNTIDEGQPYSAIIDFAHTPDAFERLLKGLRAATNGKLVVLFGSAGRRDESKRAAQGEIAGHYADEVVLTEEDDRDIDGMSILKQIAEGAEKAGKTKDKDLFLILDRTEAISFALTRVAQPEDTVVFLGKGHEKTIERADGEHSWNEAETVRAAISRQTSANSRQKDE